MGDNQRPNTSCDICNCLIIGWCINRSKLFYLAFSIFIYFSTINIFMQDYNYLLRFPFSNQAKEYISNKRIDLLSVDYKILEKVKKFLITEINQDYKTLEKYWFNISKNDDEIIAYSYVVIYPLSKIILSIIDNTPLTQSFANYYQKDFFIF